MTESAGTKATETGRNVGTTALEWWQAIQDDKGGKAQLKRCGEPTEVFFCPAFHDLVRGLDAWGRRQKETAAVMAGVLAHVKSDVTSVGFAAQMAAPKGGSRDRTIIAGSRFRRLIQIKEREDLFMPLIRVVRLLESKVNVADLAESIYYWGDPRRRDWACAYYAAAPEGEK